MPQHECCCEHLEFVRDEKGASLLLLNLLGSTGWELVQAVTRQS